jgi:hypothetical protein
MRKVIIYALVALTALAVPFTLPPYVLISR